MITVIAVDDEPPALHVIENFCSQVDFIDLQKTFSKANEALKHLAKFPVDLLFLDINMPSVSGIEFYKSLPEKMMVIFTTAYSEYAVEGFNLDAVDYLLKPFTFQRFLQAANKAQEYYNFSHQKNIEDKFLFIRVDYSLVKIAMADIIFIEGLDDYLKIHLQNQKAVIARMTMKTMLEKLPPNEFIRVHRSFIISFSRIKNVRNKIISIGEEEIPIGISYETAFFQKFKS